MLRSRACAASRSTRATGRAFILRDACFASSQDEGAERDRTTKYRKQPHAKELEIGVVGGFARGCRAGGIIQFFLLSAVGSTAKSKIRYVRVMGLKEEAVQAIGFQRLAIFRPGIIAGNAHTPRYVAWLGHLIPGRFGTIEQDDIGRAFVAEFISSSAENGVVYLENGAMRQRSRALT
jgi:uncharacterized protein YbjT (DUF2867 family)